jgi:hypothetical protein
MDSASSVIFANSENVSCGGQRLIANHFANDVIAHSSSTLPPRFFSSRRAAAFDGQRFEEVELDQGSIPSVERESKSVALDKHAGPGGFGVG